MSYLQPILTELFTSATDKRKTLSGGARLDWVASSKRLIATRLNRGLESTPSEQKTFEREIRACGYAHTEAMTYAQQIDTMNQRIGVAWFIAKARPSKRQLKAEAQESLF